MTSQFIGHDSKSPDSEGGHEEIHGIIRSIGYVSLCVSLFLFLTIKIMKYLLARKKFNWKITNSTPTTPNSITPMLKSQRGPMVERSYTP